MTTSKNRPHAASHGADRQTTMPCPRRHRLAGTLVLVVTALLLGGAGHAIAKPGGADKDASNPPTSKQPSSQKPPRLLRDTVLRATPGYVIWTVGGSTKVGRDRFHIPGKRWVHGKLQPTPDSATVRVDQVRQSGRRAIKLSAAGGEYEPVQVVITPRRGDLKIGKVEISDLTGEHGRISAKQVSVRLVGYVWGSNPIRKHNAAVKHGERPKKKSGPFADPLLPEGTKTLAKRGRNYTLYLEAYVPPKTPPGDYQGRVTLHVNGKSLAPLPLRLHVWGFTLPHKTTVDSNLLNIDKRSISYWYGIAPWEPRYRKIVKAFLADMARHRFSPATTPPMKRINWRTFPVQVKGKSGKALDFRDGRSLQLHGPRFEKMADDDGFTVGFWLKADGENKKSPHLLIKQTRWQAGYRLALADGKLKGVIVLATMPDKPRGWHRGKGPDPSKLHRTVTAAYPGDGDWHHVAFAYQPTQLALFIDGGQAAKKSIDRQMAPAYGGVPTLKGAGLEIDELNWSDEALSDEQMRKRSSSSTAARGQLAEYSFDQPRYDFASKVQKGDPVELDRQYFVQWADWAGAHGLYVNKIRKAPPVDASLAQIKRFNKRYWQPLRERHLLGRSYLRLPNDEAVTGSRGKQNRQWAKQVRQVAPDLRLHTTFGGMGGSGVSPAEKRKQLERFVGLIDIWSMRVDVFTDVMKFFKQRVAAGETLSLYIHHTNVVEEPTVLNASRTFFWLLFKHHISAYTFWNVNKWFAPVIRGGLLPARRIWRVPWGFRLTQQYFSIDDGMIFYPGENGPIDSLRSQVWRDGMEDYEYLTRLRTLVDQAKKSGRAEDPAVRSAGAILKRVDDMHPIDRLWESRPTSDVSRLRNLRRRAARAIEQLQAKARESRPRSSGRPGRTAHGQDAR